MLNIIKSNRDLNKIEIYSMTSNPAIRVVKDIPTETELPVDDWILYEEENEESGEMVELLCFKSGTEFYACQSETFKREFFKIVDLMGDDAFSIVKMDGESKAGRKFVTCRLKF